MDRSHATFYPIISSHTSFDTALASSATSQVLESTAGGAPDRTWAGPGGRAVRVTSKTGDDFYIAFGSSLVQASTAESMLVLGSVSEVFRLPRPQDTFVSVISSTSVIVNFCLGYGG